MKRVYYDWDIETVDILTGDIVDHDHYRTMPDPKLPLPLDSDERLVLVCDEYGAHGPAQERSWAYVDECGNLPEVFRDAYGKETRPVPRWLLDQFKRFGSITQNPEAVHA